MTDNVHIKRKVTIKVKQSEDPKLLEPQCGEAKGGGDSQTPPPVDLGSEKKPLWKKWWLWLLVVVFAAIAAWCLCKGGSFEQEGNGNGSVGPTDTATVAKTDSVVNDTTSTESDQPKEEETTNVPSAESEGADSQPSSNGTQDVTVDKAPIADASTVESKAKEVIRGKYGNGQTRKDNLGASYGEIQSKVNEMYRKGLVK